EEALRAEIDRLNETLQTLMRHAEDSGSVRGEDFDLVQTALQLVDELRQRTAELVESTLNENRKISRALHESEEKFHRLIEQSLVGISLSDMQRFNYVNPKFAEITGYSADELMRMGPLDITPEAEIPRASEMMRQGLAGRFDSNFTAVIHVRRKDGVTVIAELTGGPPVDVDGKPALIAMIVDITDKVRAENEIKILNAQLREQAIRDSLTSLFNRRYLEESLARELIRARREGKPVSLVMGDLDYFKAVNDSYGHQFGDKVLQAFGEMIRQYSRGSDIPCRYGGEEFLMVMPNMSGEKALDRAELLRAMIAGTPIEIDGVSVPISASFGVAVFPEHAGDADKLIAAADRALYQAKESGRNRVMLSGA
ncbi:MAG TPA: sensor domain-containing diguanylate cyclase, partial [Mariprofundaceae bacterium]|nr:sensor domain-containing diguanylate cyclase [Mariprofundaceae bacterium]